MQCPALYDPRPQEAQGDREGAFGGRLVPRQANMGQRPAGALRDEGCTRGTRESQVRQLDENKQVIMVEAAGVELFHRTEAS